MAKTGVCRDWPMKKGVSCGAHRYDTFSKTGIWFKKNQQKSGKIVKNPRKSANRRAKAGEQLIKQLDI